MICESDGALRTRIANVSFTTWFVTNAWTQCGWITALEKPFMMQMGNAQRTLVLCCSGFPKLLHFCQCRADNALLIHEQCGTSSQKRCHSYPYHQWGSFRRCLCNTTCNHASASTVCCIGTAVDSEDHRENHEQHASNSITAWRTSSILNMVTVLEANDTQNATRQDTSTTAVVCKDRWEPVLGFGKHTVNQFFSSSKFKRSFSLDTNGIIDERQDALLVVPFWFQAVQGTISVECENRWKSSCTHNILCKQSGFTAITAKSQEAQRGFMCQPL
jgi:hypothetical protein